MAPRQPRSGEEGQPSSEIISTLQALSAVVNGREATDQQWAQARSFVAGLRGGQQPTQDSVIADAFKAVSSSCKAGAPAVAAYQLGQYLAEFENDMRRAQAIAREAAKEGEP